MTIFYRKRALTHIHTPSPQHHNVFFLTGHSPLTLVAQIYNSKEQESLPIFTGYPQLHVWETFPEFTARNNEDY